ncbi:DNA N-6-adenine-methyltransferase [Sphingomonas sp. Marseille-Q8236]
MSHWETPGASDEWYTPGYVFDALGERFDIDVAAPNDGPMHVPTGRWLSAPNGLVHDWTGFVWMNSPFGGRGALVPWLEKFFAHGHGIALTPDRTSAPWFWDAWSKADRVLFTRKIRFLRPDGTEGVSPSNGTCLWAAGDRAVVALERAATAGLGILGQPLRSIAA